VQSTGVHGFISGLPIHPTACNALDGSWDW
jgi:hypothetical protein